MARIVQRPPHAPAPQTAPVAWRATKAMAGAAARPIARVVRRLVVLAAIVAFIAWYASAVVARVRTPGQPTRVVTASAGEVLARIRQAGHDQLTLSEQDLTAAFQQALRLPTVPFESGQVAVVGDGLEVHGLVRQSTLSATITAVPSVVDGDLVLAVRSIRIGQQRVPTFLAGVFSFSSVGQLTTAANAILPDLRAVQLRESSVTLLFL